MGYDLRDWALRVEHPCLTPRTRQVLAAVCLVAHDEHGEFWMRGRAFLDENIPDMSYGAYRNHLSILVRSGLLLKIGHGGGPTKLGRGTTTRYRVNSPVVGDPHPAQHVLPEIARSPEALQRSPEATDERPYVSAVEAHQYLDELMRAGIAPGRIVEMLKAVGSTLTGSQNMPGVVTCSPDMSEELTCLEQNSGFSEEHVRPYMSGDVTGLPNMSDCLTCSEGETCQESRHVWAKHVSSADTPSIHEEKEHEEKEEAAAAANMSDSASEGLTGFFELLAGSLARAGHPGIRATQFADLRGFLGEYETLTGSPPDERTAEYIARRVRESGGVRNVVGFARRIAEDVLRTGEGYVERVQAPVSRSPPPEVVAEPAPDWELLHLAHVEQVSPAGEVWADVLEALRSQAPRPAFETWLAGSEGWAYAEGRFVVGAPNRFAAEMLEARLHPLIERALRDITGAELSIGYAVAPRGDENCLRCQAQSVAS